MRRKFFCIFLLMALFFSFAASTQADWSSLLSKAGISTKTTLNDTKIGAGLKEALKVGIDNTVKMTSKQDGYLGNPSIKIMMPEKIRALEGGLRKIGMGPKMDEFILSMNRAAEKAAPQARDIFIEAIASMSIEDVQKLYKGGDTAATEYFKSKTSAHLTKVYKPVVAKSMTDYGVTRHYQMITGKMKALPLAGAVKPPEIEDYVVQKSLDGLFKVLGEQEKKIRQDPAAQVTQLLKDVFSKKG